MDPSIIATPNNRGVMEVEDSSASTGSDAPRQVSPFETAQQESRSHQQLPTMPQLHIRTHCVVVPTAPQHHQPSLAPRAVEMSSRHSRSCPDVRSSSTDVCWDELETSSDEELGPASSFHANASWSAAAAGAFEPFAVEEQATEVRYLRDMYSKKERECEHLRQIIKELSQSRAKVQKTKVQLEEQFVALQQEYYRVNKVSELARTVSQQATARSSSLKSELAAAHDQARRSRRRAAAAEAKAAAVADENTKLKQKLALLEQLRLSGDDFRPSACAREYLFSHSVSLY